jgi:DNA-binding response OmpR family regulator
MSASETRVLIIEDNDALRVMLFTILRHQPLGVDTAENADEAMEKVRTCDYALIILDMDLAAGGSLSFLETFRHERPSATTFILAVRDPARELPMEPELVSAIMNKPIEIDTLADVVRECALVVPPPDDPLPCPPAESEPRRPRFDADASWPN